MAAAHQELGSPACSSSHPLHAHDPNILRQPRAVKCRHLQEGARGDSHFIPVTKSEASISFQE
eukprot:766555-Hanusia_phi.AAC.4